MCGSVRLGMTIACVCLAAACERPFLSNQPAIEAPSLQLSTPCDPACNPGQKCLAGRCVCLPETCAGCCAGDTCHESSAATCGANGTMCRACDEDSPCSNGECAPLCDPSSCEGGCCLANGCAPGTSESACGSGSACVDCTTSMSGARCRSGKCGCNTADDCPTGTACGPDHVCTPSCTSGQACHGGCCDGVSCVAGDSSSACGHGGSLCADCTLGASGTACVNGDCGCETEGDCPAGKTCASNFCASTGPACPDCTSDPAGHACIAGSCGCNDASDCPSGKACMNHQCGDACDPDDGASCHGGCCKPSLLPSGQATCFVNSTLWDQCGNDGNWCVECEPQQACVQGVCGSTCTETSSCRDGCCNVPPGAPFPLGTCAVGNVTEACGTDQYCTVCSAQSDPMKPVCRADTRMCGCNTAADCGPLETCTASNVCSPVGCDGSHLCKTGCCNGGTCVAGTSNDACGDQGGACGTCAANTEKPQCIGTATGGTCSCTTATLGRCPPFRTCRTDLGKCSAEVGCYTGTGVMTQRCNGGVIISAGACDPPQTNKSLFICANGTSLTLCGNGGRPDAWNCPDDLLMNSCVPTCRTDPSNPDSAALPLDCGGLGQAGCAGYHCGSNTVFGGECQ